MTPPWIRRLAIATATVAASAAFASAADAETIVGLTNSNQLIKFDSATPGTLIGSATSVTGLHAGDTLISIDRNPVDGSLYGLGGTSYLYRITDAGVATQIGGQLNPVLAGSNSQLEITSGGYAHITTSARKSRLISTDDGSNFPQNDLAYAAGDSYEAPSGDAPVITGVAYASNGAFNNSQTAYEYDYANDAFGTLGSVNGSPDFPTQGKLHSIGSSGISAVNNINGLDVAQNGTVYALTEDGADMKVHLYTVNTTSGLFTSAGLVGNGAATTIDIATDVAVNTYKFSAPSYTIGESAGKVTLTVTRGQSVGSGQVLLTTADASALAGTDYVSKSIQVNFNDGQSSRTVDIALRSDALAEGDETFTAVLTAPKYGHATIAAPSTAVVQINDNDSGAVPSEPLTLLTQANELVTIDSANPTTVSAPRAITGLQPGELVNGIDRRPATGQLYAVTRQSRLYTIDEPTGAATQVGSGQFSPPLAGTAVGFDIDPVNDQARIVSFQGGQNLHVNLDDATVTGDSPLIYNLGQSKMGTPSTTALAYDNNVPGATSTTLYGYDYTSDLFTRIGSPGGSPSAASSGATQIISTSGFSASGSENNDLEVTPAGNAWGLFRDGGLTRLNLVDVGTGDLAAVGLIGDGSDLYRDLTGPAVANTIQLDGASVGVTENGGSATVKVVRSQGLGAASVDYSTANGSASAGSDYTATTGTLKFAAGETSKNIAIPVADDSRAEGPETLTLSLANARGGVASLGSATAATVTIADNDKAGGPGSDPKAKVTLCGKTKQDLVKQKYVAICLTSNETATADLTGKLTVKGVKKPFTLTKLKGQKLKAGKALTVKVKLSKKLVAAVKKRKKATATITIAVKDGGGNVTSTSRKVTFSRTK